MSKSMALVDVGLMALLGAVIGAVVPLSVLSAHAETRAYPLPHHIPKYPGGVSLRFAMVHDVLTERFAKHGPAYYQERNRRVRKELEEIKAKSGAGDKPSEAYFALLDDLGSGLEFLDDHDEAIRVLRGKLEQQQSHGFEGRQLYTTYANLGTFLIHGSFAKARSGDAAAKKNLREGLDFIRQSIAVNPQAHFGRETWQAVAVEYMLVAIENPALVLKYDMIGDRLDQVVDPNQTHWGDAERWGTHGMNRDAAYFLEHPASDSSPDHFRRFITRVGVQQGWKEAVPTSHTKPVPFDEPALGIIGMWRLGGGANPHFGLALGEIMMRVGQRYLAWTSYERATQMAERFWPEPVIQQRFMNHCRDRQKIIEGQLPNEDWMARRKQFDDELNFGRSYQKAYQDYEAKRIEEGASIDEPDFYKAFHAEHGPIASPVGDEDKYLVRGGGLGIHLPYAAMVLFSGVFAFGTSCVLRIANSRRQDEAKVSWKPE